MNTRDLRVLKVLLIDDEPFIRTTIRQILVQMGIPHGNVYEANAVGPGMQETMRVRPHLVLCDIHMPEQDGLMYLAKLRSSSLPDVAATPVVMLTSDSSQSAVVAAKGLNADGYLVKPVSLTAVKKALDRALKPAEDPQSVEGEPHLVVTGKAEDLRMIAAFIKELYEVQIVAHY